MKERERKIWEMTKENAGIDKNHFLIISVAKI